MTTGQIFSKWDETHSDLWSHQPIRLEHQMHNSPAFSMDEIARLIESYPREHYSLVKTGAKNSTAIMRTVCMAMTNDTSTLVEAAMMA